ncbi:CHAT domain-containing protein [Adhaeribacter radiodurans]|uniref:CHAT domain-containing protein n=1 Tax=Adhaeribacter radiodurans TaxID=2745197 RepID=A0A7L7LB42_9BACT|nr:CHAT domain-containing tetratricopeptide repeat protein [Adhaeribacter radiodurans]QMU29983.1 CHAT domain-containing protein [Adhaeribacter radiodurans]
MNMLIAVKLITVVLFAAFYFSAAECSAQKATYQQQAQQLCDEAYTLLFLQGKDSLALLKYQQVKANYFNKPAVDSNLVDACFGMGVIYQIRRNFTQAIKQYKESITYQQKITPEKDSSNFYPYVLIAENFIHLNYYDSAYTYYRNAEHLLIRYPNIPQAQRFYNGMGNLYYLLGNYTQSTNYYEKVLKNLNPDGKSFQQLNENDAYRYIMYSNNIATAYRKLGLYQPAIQNIKGLIRYGILPNLLYQNIAVTYLQYNQLDSAITYLQKIITDKTKGASLDIIGEQIDLYNNWGTVYLKTKNFNKALFNFDKAQQISIANYGFKNDGLAIAFAGKGQVYEKLRNYPLALQHYQSALQALHFTFNNANVYQNPPDFNGTVSSLLLFEVLKNKAGTFRQFYNQTRKTSDLEASLQTYELAFQLADRIRKSYDSDEAKLFFNRTVAPTYEEAIATAFHLFEQTQQKSYLETAFALAEGSKAAVLAESLRKLEIKNISGISPRLRQQEADLKRNNVALQVKLVEDTVSNFRREMYRDRLRENEIKLAKIDKEFENNKQYYQLKYDTQPVKVSPIQEKLSKQTAIVEYFIGKNNLYVFVITSQSFEAKQLNSTKAFRKNWAILHKAFYQPEPTFGLPESQAAHQLYQQLIAPVAASLTGKQRLVIIPDKELGYVPFEALISDTNTNHYLIQDKIISYAYSGKLLPTGSTNKLVNQEALVLAMAPFGAKNHDTKTARRAGMFASLDASADEVNQIGNQVFIGPDATKALFERLASKSDIIHLATHASVNNQETLQSFIAFYPSDSLNNYRLYISEIYDLNLSKLKLIVLSACETGNGQLVQGEGIMSLARAFRYAGCPSTVTTLWPAEDKATAYITTRLHAYLKAGKPKDEAVQLAKLDCLKNQTNPQFQSPVYWANLIFIGDEAPIYQTTNYAIVVWIAGSMLVVFSVLWLFYKRGIIQKSTTKNSDTPPSLIPLT